MSGWTEREEGNVKIIHHSTSSSVEIQITSSVEYEQSQFRDETHSTWVEYDTLENLKKAILTIDEGEEAYSLLAEKLGLTEVSNIPNTWKSESGEEFILTMYGFRKRRF